MFERAPQTRDVIVRDTSEIRAARDQVADAAAAHVGADRAEDVRLAVSELITNAIEHGDGGDTTVEYFSNGAEFVVTVTTASSATMPTRPASPARPDQLSGRGLHIVASVADAVLISGDGDAVAVSCSFRF